MSICMPALTAIVPLDSLSKYQRSNYIFKKLSLSKEKEKEDGMSESKGSSNNNDNDDDDDQR